MSDRTENNIASELLRAEAATETDSVQDFSLYTSPSASLLPMKTRSSPKLTVVLDLDETLVHCSMLNESPDLILQLGNTTGYVKFRPGLLYFLEKAHELFELVVFTASEQTYASAILNRIDPDRRLIKFRLFRESCSFQKIGYVKDLGRLNRDLRSVVIVDNSVVSFANHIYNGIPILTWKGDPSDCELYSLLPYLTRLSLASDVRPYLRNTFKIGIK